MVQAAKPRATDIAVILFWVSGGRGHMETWDAKPDAVDQFRGPLGVIPTSLLGVRFGELVPESAKLADRLAVLRSVTHATGDYTKGDHWMLTVFKGSDFNAPSRNVGTADGLSGRRRECPQGVRVVDRLSAAWLG